MEAKKNYWLLIAGISAMALFIGTGVKAVTISELNVEISADPGQTIERTVKIYDDSKTGATVYPWVFNFTADPNKEGAAIVQYDSKDLKPDRAWIKFDQPSINLPPDGSLVDFKYKIVLPADAEPGTHLLSLVFRSSPPPQDAQATTVYIGTNVVSDIFLRVSGTTIDKLEIDFQSGTYTKKDDTLAPADLKKYFKPKNFFFKPPVDFSLVVNNTGNTHQRPDGNIKIVNDFFGGTPEKDSLNTDAKIVLPGTSRSLAVKSFGQGFMFGKYRAKATLIYGNPLREASQEIVFWIIPVVEIAIALGIIILIIIILIIFRHRSKKNKIKKEKELRDQILQEMGHPVPASGHGLGAQPVRKNKTILIISIVAGCLLVLDAGFFAYINLNKSGVDDNANAATNINASLVNKNNSNNTNTLNSNITNVNSASSINLNSATNLNVNASVNTAANNNSNATADPLLNANFTGNINMACYVNGSLDSDCDGLNDVDELKYGTDPLNPDTDGDGVFDGAEVLAGTNPNGTGPLNVNLNPNSNSNQ